MTDLTPLFIWALIIPLVALVSCIYFLPSIVAFSRNHPQSWLLALLNLILGVTVIGWICLFIWAIFGVAGNPLGMRLEEAHRLFKAGMITKDEYDQLRSRCLNSE